MRLQNLKLLTGATLSVLLSLGAMYPATAKPIDISQGASTNQSPEQTNSSQSVTGTVQSVDGNVAKIQLSTGEVRNITLNRDDMARLNLHPGMLITATTMPDGTISVSQANGTGTDTTDTQMNGTTGNSSTINTTGLNIAPGQTVIGTITSITNDGDITMTLPDGSLRNVTINRQLRQGLNLTPGMRIAITRTMNGMLSVSTNVQNNQTTTSTYNNGSDMTVKRTVRGTISSINGNTVTVTMANGQTQDIAIDQSLIDRLNLQPGNRIIVRMRNDGSMSVALGDSTWQNNTSTNSSGQNGNVTVQQTVRGTVTSVNGNTVTVRTANGQSQDITIDQSLANQINLQPGTRIVVRMLSNGSMTVAVGNNSWQNNASTYSNTQNGMTRQRTTVYRSSTRYTNASGSQMTDQNQQMNQVQQNNTPTTTTPAITPNNTPTTTTPAITPNNGVNGLW
jgi:antitoxin component of MazEF toxin-antitoxin module